ncbi:MAG: Type 1 glutamine amidotransferase-like domain-containing protein [Candidatus Woesearchaeota archaeon]|jgi:dipeptidase E
MKLLLTSAGIVPEIREEFLSLLSKKSSQIKAVLVETAIYGENLAPEKLKEYSKQTIEQLKGCGVVNITNVDIREQSSQSLSVILDNVDILIIDGGNTFYLLDWIKKNQLDKVIVDHVKKGLIYVGISAGSYIACPTIEMAAWGYQDRNRCGLKDLTSLNLVPFLITAHYAGEYKKIIETSAKNTTYPVVAITDSQALLIVDGKVKLIGKGQPNFFNGFKES